MSDVQRSPSLTAKMKTREAVNKIKHGSPKLQEVLRQRCRERMKEKRGQLFNKRRDGLMEVDDEMNQALLTEILRREFSQLATLDGTGDILLGEESSVPMSQDEALAWENEFWLEEEQWILQEFEKMQQEEAETLAFLAEESLKENVICPLCEKGAISEVLNFLSCPACNLCLPFKMSAKNFGRLIQENVALHSSGCGARPSFMLLPENNTQSLYLTCETCSVFSVIV